VNKLQGIIAGPIVIENIGGSSVVQFGSSVFLSPKHISKTFSGAGGGHTAAVNISFTGPSSTNTAEFDVIDQPVSGNI
jgi:spore germination protein PF